MVGHELVEQSLGWSKLVVNHIGAKRNIGMAVQRPNPSTHGGGLWQLVGLIFHGDMYKGQAAVGCAFGEPTFRIMERAARAQRGPQPLLLAHPNAVVLVTAPSHTNPRPKQNRHRNMFLPRITLVSPHCFRSKIAIRDQTSDPSH